MLHCQYKLKGFFQRLNLMNLLRIPNRVQEALEREAFKILNSQPEQPYLPYILQTLHYQQCMKMHELPTENECSESIPLSDRIANGKRKNILSF